MANELIKQGYIISILAIADRFTDVIVKEKRGTPHNNFEILRLPYKEPFIHKAKEWVDTQDPDWLSLQYVPFSFNDRGLHFGLSKDLLEIGKNRKWQIMFHELWVGMEKGSKLKFHVWGILQRFLIKRLLENLCPAVIHTQSKLYQAHLKDLGYRAIYLPLFSNIPNIRKSKSNLPNGKSEKRKEVRFIVFGTIQKNAPIKEFAKEARKFQKEKGIKLKLIIVGRAHAEQELWRKIWASNNLEVELLGELSPPDVSDAMLNSSVGLATTVYPKIEKSGSVAALREHDLRVICVAGAWQPRLNTYIPSNSSIIQYKIGNFNSCLRAALDTQREIPSDISSITAKFIKNLEAGVI
ncbi:hypothetical protein RM549_03510 [Salegentibacter sp. F188]|uniref:Glycosyltransferase n=1 Tax=Autumnicola patrickiae TaxID=3075591 RepID=A0ABU3DYM4_9FLAO|nr:hypothetical protein [Salegentibacter sp. F188]MDT0688834.1 hypothetical protein [Salegentibacter sp. F188]